MIMRYAVRISNDTFESHNQEILMISNSYGIENIVDKGKVLYLVFKTRNQATGFVTEMFGTTLMNKPFEWYER